MKLSKRFFLTIFACCVTLFSLTVTVFAAGEPAAITVADYLAQTNNHYLCQYDANYADFDEFLSDVPAEGKYAYWDANTVVTVFMNGDFPAFYYDDTLFECLGQAGLVEAVPYDPLEDLTDYQRTVVDFIKFAEGFLVFIIVVVLAYFSYKFLRMFF